MQGLFWITNYCLPQMLQLPTVKHLCHNTASRLNGLDQPSSRDFDDQQGKIKHLIRDLKLKGLYIKTHMRVMQVVNWVAGA